MKMNMIIGKKQLVLACLAVGLSLAVYLNWQFSKVNGDFSVSDIINSDKHYGDTVLVDTPASDKECELLVDARINRDAARAEAKEAIASVLADTSLDEKTTAELTDKTAAISAAIEMENKVESIIKAKGMNSVVYITDAGANVTVQSEDGLSDRQAVQIQEAIITECGIKAEKIIIVEVK